ncbi:2-methylcitrate dehydratase PrpD [Altererythrobacter atlanticus]|uniref:MmgE/PrpD family protein n=1 Tax=Croceibacterium atlanticum TaxID=1267766 RepID=A0A0F7KRU9_9SPHN|nr:MmgE/PrpD family protein [Croceibacterium atlanticum]AKH41957.1 MmgE/PrpD family protein [Croceibacterium atlanticum]MBB5733475.1 2-methylcitrate dehydratase PrpD [Croceibacterium atlanticum]
MSARPVSLSDKIAAHTANFQFEDLPSSIVRSVKHVLLDAVGVMLGASGLSREVQPFLEYARNAGEGPSTILGTGLSAPPATAALVNGAMAHALDYEDAFDPAPGHPNASLVPALIALAQSAGPVDGRRFLAALAVGGDLSCRLAIALDRQMEEGNWYPPPITAGFGATAGASSLIGLDPVDVRDALSLALCQITMPGEIKYSPRSSIRAIREGFPAQAAVQSVLLAQAGVAGFERPLEGKGGFYSLYALGAFDEHRLLDRLGERFWQDELTFKPWPSCRGTHPFIEAALEWRRGGGHPDDIASVKLLIDPVQQMLVEPLARKAAPQLAINAKFSIPFCTALALIRGSVSLEDFEPDNIRDPGILELAGLCHYEIAPRDDWQRGAGGALIVTQRNGESREIAVGKALGAPSRPMSEADLRAKFIACCGKSAACLGHGDAERLADAILGIETAMNAGAIFE